MAFYDSFFDKGPSEVFYLGFPSKDIDIVEIKVSYRQCLICAFHLHIRNRKYFFSSYLQHIIEHMSYSKASLF